MRYVVFILGQLCDMDRMLTISWSVRYRRLLYEFIWKRMGVI